MITLSSEKQLMLFHGLDLYQVQMIMKLFNISIQCL